MPQAPPAPLVPLGPLRPLVSQVPPVPLAALSKLSHLVEKYPSYWEELVFENQHYRSQLCRTLPMPSTILHHSCSSWYQWQQDSTSFGSLFPAPVPHQPYHLRRRSIE